MIRIPFTRWHFEGLSFDKDDFMWWHTHGPFGREKEGFAQYYGYWDSCLVNFLWFEATFLDLYEKK